MLESTRREVRSMMDELLAVHKGLMHGPAAKQCICETCGCLIAPAFAVAGEKVIRQKDAVFFRVFGVGDEYIYTPYFCKAHAPKVKEKGGKA